jgi:hypothetical protein
MLLGYGLRAGAASRVFAAIGSSLVGSGHHGLATFTGVVLSIVLALTCGVVYGMLTEDSREHWIAWAIAIGAAFAAVTFLVARTFGGSITLALTPGNLLAMGTVIAITLPIGMRFALSRL